MSHKKKSDTSSYSSMAKCYVLWNGTIDVNLGNSGEKSKIFPEL